MGGWQEIATISSGERRWDATRLGLLMATTSSAPAPRACADGVRRADAPVAGRAADRRRATLGLAPLIVAQLIELFTELRSRGSTLLLAEERARGVLDAADQVVLYEKGSDA